MNIDECFLVLDIISNKTKLTPDDTKMLLTLSENSNPEIRAYVAELFVMCTGEEIEKALIKMCTDVDELVRVNACDSLSTFATIEVYQQLRDCILKDSSMLAKSYALLSVADIIGKIHVDKNEVKRLFLVALQRSNTAVSAACFRGLYILGEKDYLKDLLGLLSARNYQDRCTVINALESIVDNENRNNIVSELKKAREIERSEAVCSAIDNLVLKTEDRGRRQGDGSSV